MSSLRLAPYGEQAALALRDAIVQAKAGDPLAPVTVVVPSNYAGLSLRHRLGSGELSLAAISGRDGLINVRFLVLARVAELLGAPTLAAHGRRPLTGPIRAEAIRAALAADPGVFHDVAEHTATERSLDATFRELRLASPQALDAAAHQSRRAEDAIRLFHDFRSRTTDYYDEEDLAVAAAAAVRAGSSALRDVGHVILFLPRRLTPGEQTLAEALAEAGGLAAVIGLTGDREADEPARELASRLQSRLGPPEEQAPSPIPSDTRIVVAADAEEEVRSALRMVMQRVDKGTPLHRMAILYPAAQPYTLLSHEQLNAAGVAHNGAAIRSLAQTASGRTLLGLLHLREADFRRDAVMDWLSAAPVLEHRNGNPAPAHAWDMISRSAGVVGTTQQWTERLARYRGSLQAKLDAPEREDEGSEGRRRGLQIEIDLTERLARFMEDLATAVDPGPRSSWGQFASWARGLLERYLGREGHWRGLPEEEKDAAIEAHRAVEAALDSLSALEDVRPHTDEATFRKALERELEAPAGRIGRFGDGVFVGRIADALGTDFDVIFVLGMTEGLMPPRERDDPILPDRERAVASDLPLRTGRSAEWRRDYLAALASAGERVLCYPRADLRGQRGRLPGRWLIETASLLEGRSLFSEDLANLTERPWFTVVPSFESALAGTDGRASKQEYDLHSLIRWQRNGGRPTEHYLTAEKRALGDGLSEEIERASVRLTRWDGRLSVHSAPVPSAQQPVSPTALQNWATCPFRYFLGHVLRVAETEKPEDTLTISALERGNLLHEALESFVSETPRRAAPDQAWTSEERARLTEIGERLCDRAEAAGLTGRPLLWRLERERILRDLAGFLDADERLRAEHGVVPEAVELSFGVPDAELAAVPVTLPDGRSVAFRGRIDRVDQAPDGSHLLVLDYKTGSPRPYRTLKIDPVQRGTALQLPIYALAARQRYGEVPAAAYYWFATERAGYETNGHPVDEAVLSRFHEALTVILGGIEMGLFPARPGPWGNGAFENCRFCAYDRVCLRERARAWQRKRLAPELREYVDLAEPED